MLHCNVLIKTVLKVSPRKWHGRLTMIKSGSRRRSLFYASGLYLAVCGGRTAAASAMHGMRSSPSWKASFARGGGR